MSHPDLRALVETDAKAAVDQARRVVKGNTHDWKAKLLLGRALRKMQAETEAAVVERDAMIEATRDPRHRAAARAIQSGKAYEANVQLKKLLDEDPDDALASVMLGMQASRANEIEVADRLLGHAVSLVPGDPGARLALADHLRRTKRFAHALAQIESLPLADRENELVLSMMAECLGEVGQGERQLELLEQLAAKAKDPMPYKVRIALALRTLGRHEEAAKTLREVLAVAPFDGTVWYNLANLKSGKFSDRDVATMEQGLSVVGLPGDHAIRLNFALGVAYEQRKNWSKAFAHFATGNDLKERKSTLRREALPAWVDMNIDQFTSKFFSARTGMGDHRADPIFIVGMQRSGSTLLEQILASHPAIEGTSELRDFPNVIRTVSERAAEADKKFSKYIEDLRPSAIAELGARYIDDTKAYRTTDKPYFIDKLPNNWSNIALIALTLPNAKIIDVRRDPLDCCFSNWKQLYAVGLEHTNRFDLMAQYYNEYLRLMRHFDDVLPGRIHRLIYEDLVEDTEGQIRLVFDYLGLEFHPDVLEFHRTDRAVRTISAAQVRQPVNRKGIAASEPYAEWLGPLREALGQTMVDWRN